MKVEIRVVPEREEPAVIVEVPVLTGEAQTLASRIRALGDTRLTGWQGDRAALLDPADILRFFGAEKEVFAQTAAGEFRLRERLYELEEGLDGHTFVRISHSEIVNLKQIAALDLTLGGTIKMTLAGGAAVCWASRRYVKKIKEALGL